MFDGMIQRFQVTAKGMNVCGIGDIDKEHCSFIAWSLLACRAVLHDDWSMRGWKGAFILQNSPFVC